MVEVWNTVVGSCSDVGCRSGNVDVSGNTDTSTLSLLLRLELSRLEPHLFLEHVPQALPLQGNYWPSTHMVYLSGYTCIPLARRGHR